MKKGFLIGLGIFLTIALTFGALVFMFIRNYVNAFKWSVHKTMTAEEKDSFSNMALYPELADCLERCADRGMRDAEYLIETYRYNSVEEMCEALPDGCRDTVERTLEEVEPAGWTLDAVTRDLHNDPVMNEGNVMTEYEERFSSMGNPIYKYIVSRKGS